MFQKPSKEQSVWNEAMQSLGLLLFLLFFAVDWYMHGLKATHIRLRSKPISYSLASTLYENRHRGRAVVVTQRPFSLLSATKKQWIRLLYKMQVEYARTLSASRRAILSAEIINAQALQFSAKIPKDTLEVDIAFLTIDDCVRIAPECCMMYITLPCPKLKLHMMTSWMPRDGEVVIYE